MPKYVVAVGITNYYEVIVEAPTPEEARKEAADFSMIDLEDREALFISWDNTYLEVWEDEYIEA